MERLSAEEFVEKLKSAPAWILGENWETNELELLVIDKDNQAATSYLGPNPLTTSYDFYTKFAGHLVELVKQPDIRARCRQPLEAITRGMDES